MDKTIKEMNQSREIDIRRRENDWNWLLISHITHLVQKFTRLDVHHCEAFFLIYSDVAVFCFNLSDFSA